MVAEYVTGILIFAGVGFASGCAIKGILRADPHAIFIELLTAPGLVYSLYNQNQDTLMAALTASIAGFILGQYYSKSYLRFERHELSPKHRRTAHRVL